MKTKTTKGLVLSALGALSFASIAAGTTYALFTSKAETNIEVNSGKVNVLQKVTVNGLTSALADPEGTYGQDENGNKYKSQEGWVNGGSVEVDEYGNLTINKMTPGDKVDFAVQMKNDSNVKIKYRFTFEAVDKSSLLASGLVVNLNGAMYDGLLSYTTEWTTLSPVENPDYSDLITGSIYLPLYRGNVFQDLDASYKLYIEAVQGNAYTLDGASYELASYLPQQTTVDANKEAKVVYNKGLADELTVDLDLPSYNAGQEVVLAVNNVDVVENASSFVVATEGNSAAAAIDLNLYIDGSKVTNNFEAIIKTKVASGLDEDTIKIEYDGEGVAFADGGRKVNTAEEVDEVGEFYYDVSSGTLIFKTNHFSNYLVTASNIYAYNKTTKFSYISFDSAVKKATDGDTIVLLKDVDLTKASLYTDNRYMIGSNNVLNNITIDGQGHKLEVIKNGLGIRTDTFTLRNIKVNNTTSAGRCIDVRPDSENAILVSDVNLENVTLRTNGGAYDQPLTIGGNSDNTIDVNIKNCDIAAKKYYAITSFNPIDCKIEDSLISGWACLYLKGPVGSKGSAGSKITINNSTLTTSNPYGGNSNSFASIMCEDTSGRITLSADNSTFNVTALTTESWQSLFGGKNMYDASIKNSVINLNGEKSIITFGDGGSTFSYDENTVVYIDGEVASEEEIQGRIFIGE